MLLEKYYPTVLERFFNWRCEQRQHVGRLEDSNENLLKYLDSNGMLKLGNPKNECEDCRHLKSKDNKEVADICGTCIRSMEVRMQVKDKYRRE
jgi:hypothetical protein